MVPFHFRQRLGFIKFRSICKQSDHGLEIKIYWANNQALKNCLKKSDFKGQTDPHQNCYPLILPQACYFRMFLDHLSSHRKHSYVSTQSAKLGNPGKVCEVPKGSVSTSIVLYHLLCKPQRHPRRQRPDKGSTPLNERSVYRPLISLITPTISSS